MAGMHADSGPTIGDLRATVRLLQRRLTLIEHLCDEAEENYLGVAVLPTQTIRTALRSDR